MSEPNKYARPMTLEEEKAAYAELVGGLDRMEARWRELLDRSLLSGDTTGADEAQLWLNELKRQRANLRKPGEPRRGA